MEDHTAGDPMTGRIWSRRSTYNLRDDLEAEGIRLCANTVAKVLRQMKYSLQCNRKSIAQTQHPERNTQFETIADTRKHFEDAGQPIISVDAKKKELIGNFKNAGRKWQNDEENVCDHDFPSLAEGKACPYGIYEPLRNLGTMVVGTSHDTPQFAVDSIHTWLQEFGWERYGDLKELLILCDSGGSNGARPRLWKYALHQQISKAYGISIRVCHYPSGASKWNPIDHRLFSFVSLNWQARPLRSYPLMLEYIRSTTTRKGLRVEAQLNTNDYPTGTKISDQQMSEINLIRHEPLPQWNYTINP